MSLPSTLAVRISSEDAGAITMSPVVVDTMALNDLTAIVLSTTGKDAVRVGEILARGVFAQGGSRFRWEPIAAAPGEIDRLVAAFPDPDPTRAFDPSRCASVRFASARGSVDLPREVASRRRWFRRRSVWDVVMELATSGNLAYSGYSYRSRNDGFVLRLGAAEAGRLREAAALAAAPGLGALLSGHVLHSVEFFASR